MTILSVGFACYDQFFFTPSFPKENSKAFSYDFIESGGGPCANAAYLLGLWGENVFYLGHLNDDIYGKKIVSEFKQAGVNTEQIIFSKEMETPLASIIVNKQSGSRTIVTRKLNTPPLLTQTEKHRLDLFCERLKENNKISILIDGHEPELSEYIVKSLPIAKVVMDAGSLRESNVHLARYTDYLVASENFALAYSGLEKFTDKHELEQSLIKLEKIARGQAFITLGEKGCAYLCNNQLKIIPSFLCKAIDTTGAGDIFHGAFIYGVSYGWELETIIQFASLTAAISLEKKGVRNAMPNLYEINKVKLRFEKNLNEYFK